MELSYAIVEVLREFSSENPTMTTHPMTLIEIQKRLSQRFGNNKSLSKIKETEFPSRKMVRKSMDALCETEALLPDKKRTIRYTEKGTPNKKYRTDYFYKSPLRDAELKYFIDAILYSNIINTKQAQQLVKNVKGLSGRNLTNMTSYSSVFGQAKYTQEIDVLKNVEVLIDAIDKQRKVKFSLNVYNTNKELTPYTKCIINPHYVVMGNSRYYLIGTYDGTEKCYLFRVDLMTQIVISNERAVGRESIDELRGGLDLSKYMHQHPYMIFGKVSKIKLRVNKSIFTQIIDWFGKDVIVLPSTETETTVDVIVEACEDAMHYWLLQYGEGVLALDMDKEFAKGMQSAAKTIYEKYGGY